MKMGLSALSWMENSTNLRVCLRKEFRLRCYAWFFIKYRQRSGEAKNEEFIIFLSRMKFQCSNDIFRYSFRYHSQDTSKYTRNHIWILIHSNFHSGFGAQRLQCTNNWAALLFESLAIGCIEGQQQHKQL